MASICVYCIICGCSCFCPIPKFCKDVKTLFTKFYTNSDSHREFCHCSLLLRVRVKSTKKKNNPHCRKCERLAWRTCGYVQYIWVFILLMSICTSIQWINFSKWCLCFSLLHHTWIGSKREKKVTDLYKSGFCTVKFHKHLRRQPNIEQIASFCPDERRRSCW